MANARRRVPCALDPTEREQTPANELLRPTFIVADDGLSRFGEVLSILETRGLREPFQPKLDRTELSG